jgi:hypothetical protein
MSRRRFALRVAFLVSLAASADVRADEQSIPPGVAREGELTVNSGPDGLCNSAAAGDDVQLAPVGGGAANTPAIGCGADGLVQSTAAGDDVQLRPLLGLCASANVPVIDSGADGIVNSAPAGDDAYLAGMAMGAGLANGPCVGTGPNALGNSLAAGDDVQELGVGLGNSNAPVVICGDDLIPSTTANNAGAGDDVQVIPVSALPTCVAANDVVVSSGPTDSISSTRAEGPEFVIRAAKPVKITIRSGESSGSKSVKLQMYNQEFGAVTLRDVAVLADDGNCPDGTLSLVDASSKEDGLDYAAAIDAGGSAKITMLATFHADRVRTVSTKIPFRCEADITAVGLDTQPEEDDARVRRNNSTKVTFEVFDYNDLP